ncbi:MAG: proline dehydrogenase family protein [Bacteroidia bacterium]
MMALDNTEIAFKHKSDKQLNKAYWLFKLVGSPFMVKLGKLFTTIAFKLRLPIKGVVKNTIFEQFCGGESIKECEHTINLLGSSKIGTILDYSVEGKDDEKDFESTCQQIIETIKKAKNNPTIPFSVFKTTGIAKMSILEKANKGLEHLTTEERKSFGDIHKRVELICRAAHQADVPIFIDAEESWIQNPIDDLAEEMMKLFNKEKPIVFNTIQLYRVDRLDFLKKSYQKAIEGNYFLGEKLVRGAYMEKERERANELGYPDPIHKTKEDTDRDYNLAVEFCAEHIERIAFCAGTHNEQSSLVLANKLKEKNMPLNHPNAYFAQLLGMSDHISFNLAANGFNVAKYVPYGPVEEVLPYLIRRAEENTSVAGQSGRELSLIIKERERRIRAKN